MLKKLSIPKTFKALVIGDAGIGKTSLLRTIDEKVLVLSAESGLLCVRDLVESEKISGFEISSFDDLKEAYSLCANDKTCKETFKWIFIDSLTEISSRCVESMKKKYPSDKDGFKMWGEYNDLMTMIIKGFRDLQDYSVVFTCLPSVEKDENNKRFIGSAIAGSSLKERLTSYFDEVLYMVINQDENNKPYRCFITQPYERCPGKDRSGKLELIEQPDLTNIKTKILGGNNAN